MRRTIEVLIGEEPVSVGVLQYDVQGARESAAFEYSNSWLTSKDAFALAPELRLIVGPQFHKKSREGSVFHDPIADTEPDGWGRTIIRRDHAKRRQVAKQSGEDVPSILTSLDFLLAVDDSSRVGALRFRNEQGEFFRPPDTSRRTTPPLIELGALVTASRAVELNTETLADLAYLRGRGTSLGGLRPKCSVVDENGHLSIGKFPSVQDQRAVTKGEVLALTLAKRAGISAADARLVSSDDIVIALVRRFDRRDGERLPYISAATMLGVDTTAPGDHAYTEIVDAIRAHGFSAQSDIDELFRRIAFSILITNVDDHLLNHGFLHVQRGLWRLAPAFDVNPFPDRTRELKTWISEETGPGATIAALMSVAPYFKIDNARARSIIAEVETAVADWRMIGAELGMSTHELEEFADAFEHDERAAAQTLRKSIGPSAPHS
jgi:serine/threonine-protein kinase HipA